MNAFVTTKTTSLDSRANALAARKKRLDVEIAAEMRRPLPCQLHLGKLKRSKLRLKDALAEIEGVLATVDRVRFAGRARKGLSISPSLRA